MFSMANPLVFSSSTSNLAEKEIRNGRIVKDIQVQSYNQRDQDHNNYFIKGKVNRTPFIITNMPVKRSYNISKKKRTRRRYKKSMKRRK
jgi:hypothetical protein